MREERLKTEPWNIPTYRSVQEKDDPGKETDGAANKLGT